MKYKEVKFNITAPEVLIQDASDLLADLLGSAGFESFADTDDGLAGYAQQGELDMAAMEATIHDFPMEGVTIHYTIADAPDEDWNAEWEAEGFAPIVIDNRCVIHDGRHLPAEVNNGIIQIEIDAKLAFGTGTHETTKMMAQALLNLDIQGKTMLDCGCGTGILGIVALKADAGKVTGYDIDEWSADNARHNAVINQVDDRYEALLGDASVLRTITERFDVVAANINRNILLQDMPAFTDHLKKDGYLLLSGFYEQDIPLLEAKAAELGWKCILKNQDGDWCMLQFCHA
jgi:ribosomal protein L11 methyltransferase